VLRISLSLLLYQVVQVGLVGTGAVGAPGLGDPSGVLDDDALPASRQRASEPGIHVFVRLRCCAERRRVLGVSPEALAQLPALVSGRNRFNQAELRARVGEIVALRLENSDTAGHYFDIDELNVHVAMPSGKPALALFKPTTPGTYTFYCHVPGHREAGMAGTLVVAP
jgi:plastocyanin